MPKHVVDFYVINNTYLFHQIVVLDIRYIPIKHLYKTYIWATYVGREGVKWVRDLVSVLKVGWCGLHGGSMLLPSYV